MKRTLTIITLLSLLLCRTAFAQDVLIVQSERVRPFEDALRGFSSICRGETKRIVMADNPGIDIVRRVRNERPELVLAIGSDALQSLRKVRNIPIVYLMVLNPQKIAGSLQNVTGVSMNVGPERFLAIIAEMPLRGKRVGLIYDPANSDHQVQKALQHARNMGLQLVAWEVTDERSYPGSLDRLVKNIDVYWMIPDNTVVTPETVEYLLLTTQRKGIPVISFSKKYVDMGALVSLDLDPVDMGKQAGVMANKILDGTPVDQIHRAEPRNVKRTFNGNVARMFGLAVDDLQ